MPSQIMVWAMERAGGRVGNWQRPTCGSGGTRTSPSEPLRPRLLLYKTDRRPQFPFSHLRPVRIYFEFPPPRLLLCLGASLSASPPSPPRRSASRPAVPRRPIRARPIRQGMATFELYRRSTIGTCLTETLDELVSSGAVSPELAIQVLVQFDKSMTEALEMQVKSKVNVKGHLHTYRFCDNVWTFILTDATFKSEEIQETLGKVKIVACDSKLLQPQQP